LVHRCSRLVHRSRCASLAQLAPPCHSLRLLVKAWESLSHRVNPCHTLSSHVTPCHALSLNWRGLLRKTRGPHTVDTLSCRVNRHDWHVKRQDSHAVLSRAALSCVALSCILMLSCLHVGSSPMASSACAMPPAAATRQHA
jgi:hypothetical protein